MCIGGRETDPTAAISARTWEIFLNFMDIPIAVYFLLHLKIHTNIEENSAVDIY